MPKKKVEEQETTGRVKLSKALSNGKLTYKRMEDREYAEIPYFIPVFPWLDYAITGFDASRRGGIPGCRLVEIYGLQSSGKSTLADLIIASVQKNLDGYGIIADYEDAHQESRMVQLGVDPDYTAFIEPKDGTSAASLALEDFFEGTEEAVEKIRKEDPTGPIVSICDALASAHMREHLEMISKENISDYGTVNMKSSLSKAKFMSDNLRKFVGRMTRKNCTIVIVNQLREKPATMFGSPYYAPGGRALPFEASLIIALKEGKHLTPDKDILREHRDPDPVGLVGGFKIDKNKIARPGIKGDFTLYFDERGVNHAENMFHMIKERGIVDWCDQIEKVGHSWSWRGERIGKSEREAIQSIDKSPELLKDMQDTIFGG
jgi:recombination protein RecA